MLFGLTHPKRKIQISLLLISKPFTIGTSIKIFDKTLISKNNSF